MTAVAIGEVKTDDWVLMLKINYSIMLCGDNDENYSKY